MKRNKIKAQEIIDGLKRNGPDTNWVRWARNDKVILPAEIHCGNGLHVLATGASASDWSSKSDGRHTRFNLWDRWRIRQAIEVWEVKNPR